MVLDLSTLDEFEYLSGLLKIGAAAYFNDERQLLGIFLCHSGKLVLSTASSGTLPCIEWEHAKFVLKASILLVSQLKDHAILHFVTSNVVSTATRMFVCTVE